MNKAKRNPETMYMNGANMIQINDDKGDRTRIPRQDQEYIQCKAQADVC